MKWLSEIWLIVSTLPVKTKTIFVFSVLVVVSGYFFFDRLLDYKEAIAGVAATENKRVIEKDISYSTDYAKDVANFDTDKKTGRGAK